MLKPKLRFPEFADEWEMKRLGDIFTERNDSQKISDDAPLLSFTIEQGIINPEDKKTNKRDFLIKDKENKKFLLTEYNDIIYNPANIKFGAIHRNKLGRGVVSPIYAIFTTDENPIFMEYMVRNERFIKKSLKYLEGTVVKLMTLKPRDFLLMYVSISSLEEQQKIADFLSKVDKKIVNQEAVVSDYEEMKKGLMQKIFNQEVRFKADDGSEYPEWEEKIFDDVFESLEYGMNTAAKDYDGSNKYIRITDIDDTSHKYLTTDIVSPSGELSDKYLVRENDILFARTGASTGKSYLYRQEDGKMYFAGFLIRGHVQESYNSFFIFTQTLTEQYDRWVKIMSIRSGQPGINATEYAQFKFLCPCLDEQQKIADCLSAMDRKIETEKKILEDWKELKKALLQQMFV